MDDELWAPIRDFGLYKISNYGRVFNTVTEQVMRTSRTTHGHVKISLVSEWDHRRYTRSVAVLVAEAFVGAPNDLCDCVVLLDGDLSNVAAHNIVWRPARHAWLYARQLRTKQPLYFRNLRVGNISTGAEYDSIVQAGMKEGLLFSDIWESTYSLKPVFPYGHIFEIIERV